MSEFEAGRYYYNEDYGDYFKVVAMEPFTVKKHGLGTFVENQSLYETKLENGVIYPKGGKL